MLGHSIDDTELLLSQLGAAGQTALGYADNLVDPVAKKAQLCVIK